MLAASSISTVVLVIVGIAGLILLAGLLAGQFRRGVVQELRETLTTAKSEIDIERSRSDRLEKELAKAHDFSVQLQAEIAGLRSEVLILRSVRVDEAKVAQAVADRLRDDVKEAIGMQTARLVEMIEKDRRG